MPSAWDPPLDSDDLPGEHRASKQQPRRTVRVGTTRGIVIAIILCVVLALYAALLALGSLLIGFVSDSCGSRGPCNFTEITFGIWLGVIGVPVVALLAIALTIVRSVRGLLWLIPIIGGFVATLVFTIAVTVGYAGADINFWNQ